MADNPNPGLNEEIGSIAPSSSEIPKKSSIYRVLRLVVMFSVPLALVVVGNQLAVEMVRVPVEQDTAEIKNNCTNRHEDPPLAWV